MGIVRKVKNLIMGIVRKVKNLIMGEDEKDVKVNHLGKAKDYKRRVNSMSQYQTAPVQVSRKDKRVMKPIYITKIYMPEHKVGDEIEKEHFETVAPSYQKSIHGELRKEKAVFN